VVDVRQQKPQHSMLKKKKKRKKINVVFVINNETKRTNEQMIQTNNKAKHKIKNKPTGS
jgi:hypothetical protein